MSRGWMFAVAALFFLGRPAAAHELTCDLGVGLAASAHGSPSLAVDGTPLMIAPAAHVLDVDVYPALLALRVVVTNLAEAPSVVTEFDGDPADRAGPGAWIFGSRLTAGLTLPVGRSAEQLVIVPVASQAECIALGGTPDGAPMCRTDANGGARVLVKFDGGQTECRARFRCGPDAPALPVWSGARQFGWEGQDTAHGIALGPNGELHLIGHSFDLLLAPAPGLLESVVASVTRDGTVRPMRPALGGGTNLRAVAADGTGAVTYAWWSLNDGSGSFVSRLARDGTVVWERQQLDVVYSLVAAGPGGTVIGASLDWSGDTLVTKYSATGDVVWEAYVATPLEDRPAALTVDVEGNTYVAGQISNPAVPATSEVFVAKIDAGGSVLWTRTIATSNLDVPVGVAVTVDGIAAVAGYSLEASTVEPWVAAFDRPGATLWTWKPDPARGISLVTAVAADPGAGFWVGASATSANVTVVRLSSGGSELWTRSHGPYGSFVSAIAVDAAGDAYLAGSTSGDVAAPNAGSLDAFVIRLGPDGNP